MNRVSVRLPEDLATWLNSLDRGEKSKVIVQALRQLKNGSENAGVAIIKAELQRLNDRLAEIEKL
jgi:Arc/MetJ-type ribon-helix-helix transcriptional regulator